MGGLWGIYRGMGGDMEMGGTWGGLGWIWGRYGDMGEEHGGVMEMLGGNMGGLGGYGRFGVDMGGNWGVRGYRRKCGRHGGSSGGGLRGWGGHWELEGGKGMWGGLHKLGGVPPIWRGGWGLTTLREVQGGH